MQKRYAQYIPAGMVDVDGPKYFEIIQNGLTNFFKGEFGTDVLKLEESYGKVIAHFRNVVVTVAFTNYMVASITFSDDLKLDDVEQFLGTKTHHYDISFVNNTYNSLLTFVSESIERADDQEQELAATRDFDEMEFFDDDDTIEVPDFKSVSGDKINLTVVPIDETEDDLTSAWLDDSDNYEPTKPEEDYRPVEDDNQTVEWVEKPVESENKDDNEWDVLDSTVANEVNPKAQAKAPYTKKPSKLQGKKPHLEVKTLDKNKKKKKKH